MLRERTGRSAWQHLGFGNRQPAFSTQPRDDAVTIDRNGASQELQESIQDAQRLRTNFPPSIAEETRSTREAWKAKQKKEIQDDIEEGKGLGDMILDQIWEVWHWRKKGEDDE